MKAMYRLKDVSTLMSSTFLALAANSVCAPLTSPAKTYPCQLVRRDRHLLEVEDHEGHVRVRLAVVAGVRLLGELAEQKVRQDDVCQEADGTDKHAQRLVDVELGPHEALDEVEHVRHFAVGREHGLRHRPPAVGQLVQVLADAAQNQPEKVADARDDAHHQQHVQHLA
ncbi:PAX-interacting protein 1 [Babesia caballi]|uniref:PAX-interacting protein 1 n=1 Tax=Babesia caballi TaxID=5871 RepID=A0AAV4M0E6_BABCB|nr:PAX-interacting protein 1 [Babesia caballi]